MKLYEIDEENIVMPWWFTWKPMQLSHQCSLLRKDNEYYKKIFKLKTEEKEFMDHGYIWIQDDQAYINKKLHQIEDRNAQGPASLALTTKYCSPIGTGAPPQYHYAKHEIEIWIMEKCVNPKTGRKIKQGAAIYKALQKAALFYNLL